jgi:enoyl-CoA hydratase/carnithine racemase
MPEPNNMGLFLLTLGKDAKLFNQAGDNDWTLYRYKNIGVSTLDTVMGSIDTKTLNELCEMRQLVEESELDGAVLVNATKGKNDRNAVLSAGASLTELFLYIKHGFETGDWSKLPKHMTHGQLEFTGLFESSKQFYSLQLDADVFGGGGELVCSMDKRFGTTRSKISAPEYAHGFFPGWFLMFNMRRILEQNGIKSADAQEAVKRFTIDKATEGYSIKELFDMNWGFTETIVDDSMLEGNGSKYILENLATTMSKEAESYEPQRNVALITKDNEIYKRFAEQVTPEAAIMLNLYTPGVHTAFQHAARDNDLFKKICQNNAEKIIEGLAEKFGSEKAVKRYVDRIGPEEAKFVFNMKKYEKLSPA